MYQPEKYIQRDERQILEFIHAHPFATFITGTPGGEGLLATHIPVLAEGEPGDFRLYAHIANHNEQLAHLENGREGLFVFQGAHSYVSSSWYGKKDISTWDYTAVHVNFRIRRQSRAELVESLKKLVYRFEKRMDEPVFYEDLPEELLEDHLPRITGFWAQPLRVQAIDKLHQDFGTKDTNSVIAHLRSLGDAQAEKVADKIQDRHE